LSLDDATARVTLARRRRSAASCSTPVEGNVSHSARQTTRGVKHIVLAARVIHTR
jgi:hypothetical protein